MLDEQITEYNCVEPECGKAFELTESEEKFFTDKELFIPKRCPDCRKKRREEKQAEMTNN